MSGAQYTPGPWSMRGTGFGEFQISAPSADGDDPWSVGMAFGAAGFHEIDGEVESEANARLIAAAPDLLEALKALVTTGVLFGEAVALGRAAIAKAEGKP